MLPASPGFLEAGLPVAGDLVLGDEQPGFRKADIRGGEARVELDRALEIVDRLVRVREAIVREQRATSQECQVGVEVAGALPGHALHGRRIHAEFQRLRHLDRDLVLHHEYLARRPVEAHRPDVGAALGIDQLRGHAQLGTVALYAAFEQVAGTEFAPDLARVSGAVAKCERRRARDDVEFGEVRDLVQDGLGDAERQHLAVGRAAQVLERQHRNGRIAGTGRTQVRLPYQQQCDRGQQHADDGDVRIAPQPAHRGARDPLTRRIALDAPVAHLVEPGERRSDRKAEHRSDDQGDHDPPGHAQWLEGDVGNLQQEPGNQRIAHCNAQDTALLQALQPGHGPVDRHLRRGPR